MNGFSVQCSLIFELTEFLNFDKLINEGKNIS